MKKVLSPISETRMTESDSTKPCRKPACRVTFVGIVPLSRKSDSLKYTRLVSFESTCACAAS